MTLQPVEGVLGTIVKVARRDPAAANELVRLGLYETLVEQIETVRPRLEEDVDAWMGQQIAKAREVIAKRDLGDETLELYMDTLDSYVSKDFGGLVGAALALFNRQHPRDSSGRFISVRTTRSNEAKDYVRQWRETKLVGDQSQINVHYQDGDGRERTERKGVGDVDAYLDELAKDPNLNIAGLSLDRRQIPPEFGNDRQRAAFDALSGFAGGETGAAAIARGLPYSGDNVRSQSQNAQEWNRPSSPGDRQSYRRLQLTGQALQAVSLPGSSASTVGSMARLIGDLGPEAEKVLGPGIRRTAYRYRGTERRPDAELVGAVEDAQKFAQIVEKDPNAAADLIRAAVGQGKGEVPQAAGVASHYVGQPYRRWTLDRLELGLRGDTAAMMLMDAVPDQKLAEISIAAGELPPSQGVIIDADGDIVSQAQGYNGDHYLPFDLKNLADLHGGQYVRTRAAGGPTTEDIYTGLLAGARQVQVVSNSGVFTLEFDPDVRGGRRYTDKATRMISRYGKLLEAIEGGKIFENDVDAARRSELRLKAYKATGWDEEAGNLRYQELLRRERLEATVNREDEEELYARAAKEVDEADVRMREAGRAGISREQRARQIEDTIRDFQNEERDTKVRQMVLDGTGYAAALKTLQQEFPFFIRDVRYQSIRDFVEDRRGRKPQLMRPNERASDRGYVKPGQTNAERTMSPADARRIPTGRGQLVPAAEVRQGEAGGPKQPQQQKAGDQPLTQAAPVNDGRVVVSTVEGTKPLMAVVGPGSLVEDRLRSALNRTAGIMDLIYLHSEGFKPLDAEETPANVSSSSKMQLAHFKTMIEFEGNPRGLTDWLYNKATDVEREKFVQGLQMAREEVAGLHDADGVNVGDKLLAKLADDPAAFDQALDDVESLVALKAPFAKPVQDMALADPEEEGKPQPFPAIVALGNKVANYDAYREAAESDDPGQFAEISQAEKDPKGYAERLAKHRRAYLSAAEKPDSGDLTDQRESLEAMQRAWAFVVAERLAEAVDEDPKAEAAERPIKKSVSRVIVWHSPSESFSKRALEQLGL